MSHIMIDIETLGKEPGCPILSIAAVQFGPEGVSATNNIYVKIDWAKSIKDYGLQIDAETLKWWLSKDPATLRDQTNGTYSLRIALIQLAAFIESVGHEPLIWAKSPSFDINILEHAFKAAGVDIPWKYWQERDVRTIFGIDEALVKSYKNPVEHNALADATHQAEICSIIFGKYKIYDK